MSSHDDDPVETSKMTLTPGQSVLGWVLTANATVLGLVTGFLPWYTGGSGYTVPVVALAFLTCVILPDILFLPYMKRNIARTEAAGYSRARWIADLCFSASAVGFVMWLPTQVFGSILDAEPRFTAEFFLKAIACAVASDIPFFLLHRALHHEGLAKLHVMHHLCVDPSLAVTFFVEPLDLVMEFMLPSFFTVFLALAVLGDPWVHLGATAAHTVWALVSHDPQVKLQHYYHHAHCNSVYTFYVPVKTRDAKDVMRSLVFTIRQQERDAAKVK